MITEEIYQNYFDHLINGKRMECRQIVSGLLADEIEIKVLYEQLFQRALYQVGYLWEINQISVAVEHLATAITEYLMGLVSPVIFAAEHVNRSAVIACVANEYHQIGSRMVADTFEMNGWNGYLLGANTPIRDLLNMIDDKEPQVLGLSLSIYFNVPVLIDTIVEIQKRFPDLAILVGGQALKTGNRAFLNHYKNVTYLSSLHEVEEFISHN